jgi:hypothetical protein
VVIILFGLEAHFTKDFRAQSFALLSVPPLNSRLLLAIMVIEPVAIGSYSIHTSSLFHSLYHVGPGKTLFI